MTTQEIIAELRGMNFKLFVDEYIKDDYSLPYNKIAHYLIDNGMVTMAQDTLMSSTKYVLTVTDINRHIQFDRATNPIDLVGKNEQEQIEYLANTYTMMWASLIRWYVQRVGVREILGE